MGITACKQEVISKRMLETDRELALASCFQVRINSPVSKMSAPSDVGRDAEIELANRVAVTQRSICAGAVAAQDVRGCAQDSLTGVVTIERTARRSEFRSSHDGRSLRRRNHGAIHT